MTTEDAGRFEAAIRVGSEVEADARLRAMTELNLLAQGRRAKLAEDQFFLRIRDIARAAARKTVASSSARTTTANSQRRSLIQCRRRSQRLGRASR